jgi:hypothetical protein
MKSAERAFSGLIYQALQGIYQAIWLFLSPGAGLFWLGRRNREFISSKKIGQLLIVRLGLVRHHKFYIYLHYIQDKTIFEYGQSQ